MGQKYSKGQYAMSKIVSKLSLGPSGQGKIFVCKISYSEGQGQSRINFEQNFGLILKIRVHVRARGFLIFQHHVVKNEV